MWKLYIDPKFVQFNEQMNTFISNEQMILLFPIPIFTFPHFPIFTLFYFQIYR